MGVNLKRSYTGPMKKLVLISLASMMASDLALAKSSQPERVVELFTSQGCSSCPPANATLTKVSEDPGTLALSYGVTYWDYLGWKDTFADPKFTDRQRSYGRVFEMGNLYTPQIVLNGASHGARYSARDIGTMDLPENQIGIELELTETGLVAHCPNEAGAFKAVLVEFVSGPQTVPVKAGENRGRTLLISNVVTDVVDLGLWSSSQAGQWNILDAIKSGKSYALLMHDLETGQIKAAASYIPEN